MWPANCLKTRKRRPNFKEKFSAELHKGAVVLKCIDKSIFAELLTECLIILGRNRCETNQQYIRLVILLLFSFVQPSWCVALIRQNNRMPWLYHKKVLHNYFIPYHRKYSGQQGQHNQSEIRADLNGFEMAS